MMLDAVSDGLVYVGDVMTVIISIAIIICNIIGITVLLTSVIKSTYHYFHRDKHIKLMLARGIALSLEFKLAGEVLQTVTVRDWNELVVLGTIIALRGAIAVLIYWEIKVEKAEEKEEQEREERLASESKTQDSSDTLIS